MNKRTRFLATALILFLMSACGAEPSQGDAPTPVFVPVIVTVGIPVPVTVTPSDMTSVASTNGGAQNSVSQTVERENLEENGQEWHGFEDRGIPLWILQNTDSPALFGKSLQCSITGGDPYSGIHCYREFEPVPQANAFGLDLAFRFTPTTACNNDGADSVVQAIEFSMSKWENSQRFEFAVQWQNVGEGAPQWRYWDGSRAGDERWVPINSNAKYCVESDQWHTLALYGDIINDQVHYKSLTVDSFSHNLDLTMPAAPAQNERDRLAVAIQVNGNAVQAPYDVFIDNVKFSTEQNVDCNAIAALQQNTEFSFQTDLDFVKFDDPTTTEQEDIDLYIVSKNTSITWNPACLMDLQYYQFGEPFTKKDASSGQYNFDFDEILIGVETELKIWRGGEIIKTIWVRVKE